MQDKQRKILTAALKIIPSHGWSQHALALANIDAGFEEGYERIAFPGGVNELLDFYLDDVNKQMVEEIKKQKLANLKIREKVSLCLVKRLEILNKNKAVASKTTAYLTSPFNLCKAGKYAWQVADIIWYQIGDKSTDFNYYTKRTILSAVYSSTILYWLKDDSADFRDTKEFIDRRIENVMQINKLKKFKKA